MSHVLTISFFNYRDTKNEHDWVNFRILYQQSIQTNLLVVEVFIIFMSKTHNLNNIIFFPRDIGLFKAYIAHYHLNVGQ